MFSLGATLYTAVEGVPPFGDDGQSPERPPENAGPLAGALQKMLRADPAARPTMDDTVHALKAITVGREQTAFIPPTAPALPTLPASRPLPAQQPNVPEPTQQIQPDATQQILPQQQPQQPAPLMQLPVQQVPQAPAPAQPMQQQVMQQPTARYTPTPAQQAASAQAVREKAAARRRIILTVAAILCAILIGIGVSQLLFV